MKLKDLKPVLFSSRGCIQFAIVYDRESDLDLEDGCSVEYAIEKYGERIVQRIGAVEDRLLITI